MNPAAPAPGPAGLAVAAAHGITPRTAATWYPPLVRTPRVLVPVELDVLVVRQPGAAWADCAMRTPPRSTDCGATPPDTHTADLLPPPFQDLPQPRPRGAYLQWYLPSALTSATVDPSTGTACFPAIPDRWLVLRLTNATTQHRRAVRGWVLEAGGGQPAAYDLDTWTEPGQPPDVCNPLTALGHGDLSWSGYFDNVINRLAFADNTLDSDGINGLISYLVCGWYADPALDPLGSQDIQSLTDFNAQMSQLGWQLDSFDLTEITDRYQATTRVSSSLGLQTRTPDGIVAAQGLYSTPASDLGPGPPYVTDGSWWPQASLFHGAAVGIGWPGAGKLVTETGGPPDPATITIAVGNTMAETIGALVARANGTPDEAPIIEAFALGALAELNEPDGRARLDTALHTSSFGSMPGGPACTETFNQAASGPPQPPPASPPPPAPGIFASPPNRIELPTQEAPVAIGSLQVTPRHAALLRAEDTPADAGVHAVITSLGGGPQVPPSTPAATIDVARAQPRYFYPKDPMILIQGGQRSFAHHDQGFTLNGMLICRLSTVTSLSWNIPGTSEQPSVTGDDVLERGVENGSVPPACESLLQELALIDPATGAEAATQGYVPQASQPAAQRNVIVEQTVIWALRDPRVDHGPLLAHSGYTGTLPSPLAITPPTQPWIPMHLDWQAEFLPSSDPLQDWTLGELDFIPAEPGPAPGSGLVFQGRSPVTGAPASNLATAILNAITQAAATGGTAPVPTFAEAWPSPLAQHLIGKFQGLTLSSGTTSGTTAAPAADTAPPGTVGASAEPPAGSPTDSSLLSDISAALSQMDILAGGLDGLTTQMRGGIPGDSKSTPPPGTTPAPFFTIRSGYLRILRMRLVDGFGQYVDLGGSNPTTTVAASDIATTEAVSVDGSPGLIGLPPRFTAPSRIWFRYIDASITGPPTAPQQNPGPDINPLCGFLMPNHLDGSLEFFNPDGTNAGEIRPHQDGHSYWEDVPGQATASGQDPGKALTNSHLAQLARSLIDWGASDATASGEPALAALLRVIDSTLWSVDPFGHQADEHLSLLIGHPICVMRAVLRLDLCDPVATTDSKVATIPVRLGALTQWQDGLLGYFVNDDYATLHVSDAAAAGLARPIGPMQGFLQQINLVPDFYATFADDLASLPAGSTTGTTPVTHPYLDPTGTTCVRPNQAISLTLLVEPKTSVHATTGLQPRKDIGMRRAWIAASLAALTPTFRFGPVLVDPQHIRMPLATDINGTWSWDYRSDPITWTEQPATNATDDAILQPDPPTGIEGWLRLQPPAKEQ